MRPVWGDQLIEVDVAPVGVALVLALLTTVMSQHRLFW
jgi:hypothetical protein